jgi:cell division transport system ATP-binding protein
MKITFSHVSKSYGIVDAVKDISFEVDTGEFVFVVGPSGAGKSTLIKLLLNQVKPTDGSIMIDEFELTQATKSQIDYLRRQIGVIFQDYQLIPDKNIEENIALALDIVGFPSSEIPSRIDSVIIQANLSALARALAINPKIILADEPTGNLDPQNSWNLVKQLQKISKENNTTIIMTTHNQEIVDSMGKRVIKIESGKLVEPAPKVKKVKQKSNADN